MSVSSGSGQVIPQKIDIELVIVAEVIVKSQRGRGIAPECIAFMHR